MTTPLAAPAPGPLFRWETLKEVGPLVLAYRDPIPGKVLEVELVSGATVQVFRADDRQMYFCHGRTFGGTDAPGGAVSPFSGRDVQSILEQHYQVVQPESAAAAGDILVWRGLDEDTPHSAILADPVVRPGTTQLDYASRVCTKNGRLEVAVMTLDRLTSDEFEYGDSFTLYRRVW